MKPIANIVYGQEWGIIPMFFSLPNSVHLSFSNFTTTHTACSDKHNNSTNWYTNYYYVISTVNPVSY